MNLSLLAEPGRRLLEFFFNPFVGKLADEQQMQGLTRVPRRSLLSRHQHRCRMGLGMERQPAKEQRRDVVLADTEPVAQSSPQSGAGLVWRVEVAINAERDHRKPDRAAHPGAGPSLQIIRMLVDQPLNHRAYRGGGTDQRVPRLSRRDQIAPQSIDHPIRGHRMGDAAQAEIALTGEPAVPRLLLEARPGHENRSDTA